MATLVWNEALQVDHPRMDATHREFVDHLGRVEEAAGRAHDADEAARDAAVADLVSAYDAMVEHTVEHFAQEDRWMVATGYSPENCHSLQHRQVLELLREVRRRLVDQGELEWMTRLIPELIQWFDNHAQAADAGLAYHLGQVGYDTETGTLRQPLAETEAIQGCSPVGACND